MSFRQRRFGLDISLFKHIAVFVVAVMFTGILIVYSPKNALAELSPAEKAVLQEELRRVEAEKLAAEAQLKEARNQSSSLTRDINVLDAKIKAAQLDIKAKNLLIQTLGSDITAKEKHIDSLEERIARGKDSLADLMRKTRELGDSSLPEVLLSSKTVSGFYKEVDDFQSIHVGLANTFEQLRSDQAETALERDALDKRRDAEVDARYVIEQQQAEIKKDQTKKQELLSISKGNEKAYSNLVAEKEAQAAKIRSQLFTLRDSAAIPFGDAYRYALSAYNKTGVRPALVLAILTQESALGKNVGSCYLTNQATGDGINSKTGKALSKVMNPTRDVPPFIKILSSLGADPARTVVSCPQSIGWGGAMGPAQFIASTWALFVDRLKSALGVSTPDPWNPEHAIMASSMYLADLGAGKGGYTAERTAACKYYSGKPCGYVVGNTTYGNSVISKANTIQTTMIDLISGY